MSIVSASARIEAAPEQVYAIIADFANEHPRILPRQFRDFRVEKGGFGAGTVISYRLRAFGQSRECSARITEPQPGRVLVETQIDGAVTTFVVTRGPVKSQADVTITTEMPDRPGLRGRIERALTERFLRSVLAEELALLSARAVEIQALTRSSG